MKREGVAMKILKIENQKGYFLLGDGGDWQAIDSIDKNGLLKLLELYLENEAEMDSPEDKSIGNQAHSIIYKGIFEKLDQLSEDKSRFKDESERLYLDEVKKYSS
jgi:hypothetical protein